MSKLGKCPNCGEFGSFIKNPEKRYKKGKTAGAKLQAAKKDTPQRRSLGDKELERVFTQGVVPGATYLLAGQPGIGKSTLLLQLLARLKKENNSLRIAYFSAEETGQQIHERYERVIGSETTLDVYQGFDIEDILETATEYDFIAVDSIQTVSADELDSVAGSPSQVKHCSEALVELAKKNNISTLIVGHVTKGGDIAGPKYLEHLVDVVLYLEGERQGKLRFLRCRKNRYGTTDDVAIFEMQQTGLITPKNLHDVLQQRASDMPGSVFTVGIDNGRPVLVNLEALLNKTNYKYPQRTAIGIDSNRLNLTIAILEKYLKVRLGQYDIFVNIPGELSFRDSGIDLALAAALYSQHKKIKLPSELIFVGEIGLGGQILPSSYHDKRTREVSASTLIDHNRITHISQLPKTL